MSAPDMNIVWICLKMCLQLMKFYFVGFLCFTLDRNQLIMSCFRKCLCTIFLFCLKWFSTFMRFSFGYCLRLCLVFGFLNSLSWMFGYFASMLYIKKISETQFYKIKTWFIFTISIYKLKFNPTMNLVRNKFKYF